MDAVRGIYHDGVVELIERPETEATSDVLVIFPEKRKDVYKIGGLFKSRAIDYEKSEEELKNLDKSSQEHILEESGE